MSIDQKAVRTGTAVLEVRDVAVHFGGVKAVDGLSLSLTPGKIFGILGPNGSGKSTLLAAITRLVPLTRGQLLFEGEPYSDVPPHAVAKRGIARTFQTVRLLEGRTVRENILLGTDALARGRAGRREAEQRVAEAMELTGLTEVQKLRPDELSYGYQRRVEIARAIAMNPRLLLLDEPTAGMNKQEREEVSALMRKLQQERGLTQLLIEHDVQMMVDTCDYLFAMNFGVLITEGEPDSVVRDPAVQEAYLGKRGKRNA